ncbi:MAG: hypothetical protein WCY86_09020, partial [Spirosomataceae bacterium]
MVTILSVFDLLHQLSYKFLRSMHLSPADAKIINVFLMIGLIFCLSWLIDKIVNAVLTKSLQSLKINRLQPFFQALIRNQVVRKTANLIPL